MEQLPLRLFCRLDAPSVVPPDVIARITSYREAVRFCWTHRRRAKMTKRVLAEEAALYAPHVCDPSSPDALIQLAQRLGAWGRNNPNASADEDLAAGARIAKELGL